MHVEICDVSCVLVKSVKTQKQIKYKKKMLGITAEPKVYGYSFSPDNPSSSSNSFSTSPTIPDSHTFPFQGFLEEETRCRKILLFVGNASH